VGDGLHRLGHRHLLLVYGRRGEGVFFLHRRRGFTARQLTPLRPRRVGTRWQSLRIFWPAPAGPTAPARAIHRSPASLPAIPRPMDSQ
jgi:hypothetical protein